MFSWDLIMDIFEQQLYEILLIFYYIFEFQFWKGKF